MQIAIAEAKAQFAELVRKAEAGESVTLTRHGRPVAQITAAAPGTKISLIGALKGQIHIADDFDDVPDGFLEAFDAPIAPT